MSEDQWYNAWVHPKDSLVIITGAGEYLSSESFVSTPTSNSSSTTGSGIGMSTALLAVKQGYEVAGWDISEAGVLKTKELAASSGSRIHPIVCDVAKEDQVKEAMAKTLRIGKPHMLVNNAGPVAIGTSAGFPEMMAAANGMIHYVTSAFLDTKPVEGSAIVNISSVVGPVFGGGKSCLLDCARIH